MKKMIYLIIPALISLTACQPEYFEMTEDIPTETINFERLEVSKDTAYMFDTIVVKAIASGESLNYKWQKNKGTLVPKADEPNIAYFWGCPTCTGWLTISCTVSNEFGSYTESINVYILREWLPKN